MSKKRNDLSAEYIGTSLANKSIEVTNQVKPSFEGLLNEATRVKNTPFYFSKGNLFECLASAKVRVAAAEKNYIINFEPVNAGRGLYQTPEDLVMPYKDRLVCFQAKVSDDPNWIAKAFAQKKYFGMERITTSDQYENVKAIYLTKLNQGTITPEERDALAHLKPAFYDPESGASVGVTLNELKSFCGPDGKVDIELVQNYINRYENKMFIEECVNNTKSVVLTSVVVGCVVSSVKNVYKYFKNEQDGKTALKNIANDLAHSFGHGLLSSSLANLFKYSAWKNGHVFLRENVNSLVLANGTIDIGRCYIMFKCGELSFDEFLSNVIGFSILIVANLLINCVLKAHPLIKLGTTILINLVGRSIISKISCTGENVLIKHQREMELLDSVSNEIEKYNNNFKNYAIRNSERFIDIKNVLLSDFAGEYFNEPLLSLCQTLGLEEEYKTYLKFDEYIDSGDKIKVEFKRKQK